jgi:hypothetical protein
MFLYTPFGSTTLVAANVRVTPVVLFREETILASLSEAHQTSEIRFTDRVTTIPVNP